MHLPGGSYNVESEDLAIFCLGIIWLCSGKSTNVCEELVHRRHFFRLLWDINKAKIFEYLRVKVTSLYHFNCVSSCVEIHQRNVTWLQFLLLEKHTSIYVVNLHIVAEIVKLLVSHWHYHFQEVAIAHYFYRIFCESVHTQVVLDFLFMLADAVLSRHLQKCHR